MSIHFTTELPKLTVVKLDSEHEMKQLVAYIGLGHYSIDNAIMRTDDPRVQEVYYDYEYQVIYVGYTTSAGAASKIVLARLGQYMITNQIGVTHVVDANDVDGHFNTDTIPAELLKLVLFESSL